MCMNETYIKSLLGHLKDSFEVFMNLPRFYISRQSPDHGHCFALQALQIFLEIFGNLFEENFLFECKIKCGGYET